MSLMKHDWKLTEIPFNFLKAVFTFKVNVCVDRTRISLYKHNGHKFVKKGIPHAVFKTGDGQVKKYW